MGSKVRMERVLLISYMVYSILRHPTLTDHGGAPGERSLGALEEIFGRPCAQVGLHQTGVDIYPPRYHQAAVSLDHLDAPQHDQILPHLPAKDQIWGHKGMGEREAKCRNRKEEVQWLQCGGRGGGNKEGKSLSTVKVCQIFDIIGSFCTHLMSPFSM